jgi:hypothetical protein
MEFREKIDDCAGGIQFLGTGVGQAIRDRPLGRLGEFL